MFKYNDYFSLQDLVKRGYDLSADGVLDISHFQSVEDAIDDFCQNAFEVIYNLVEKYRGQAWCYAFFTDMKRNDLSGEALVFQDRLKKALIEQCIYIYDNGDTQATFNENLSPYSEKAVSAMWANILNCGRM